MTEIKLKPCPFCGGKGELRRESLIFSWVQHSFVRCEKCFARGEEITTSTEYSADEKAIEAWNRRTENETD